MADDPSTGRSAGTHGAGRSASGQSAAGRYERDRQAASRDDPGRREAGRGAPAGWGRRIAALLIDWLLANLAAFAIVRDAAVWQAPVTAIDFVPLAIFGLELWLMTAFVGASIGQRVRHLLVVRLDGKPVGLVRAFVRTALILLVVPPLIPMGDGRGLHDRLAGTMLVRAR